MNAYRLWLFLAALGLIGAVILVFHPWSKSQHKFALSFQEVVREHLEKRGLSDDSIERWLDYPNAQLQGRTPRQVLQDGDGPLVLDLADNCPEGVRFPHFGHSHHIRLDTVGNLLPLSSPDCNLSGWELLRSSRGR